MRVLILLATLGAFAAAHAQPVLRGASSASASAAPQFIGAGADDSSGGTCGNAVTPSTPAGNDGDLLIALATASDASNLTPSAGWSTLLSVNPTADHRVRIYWRFADGTGSDALTITRSGACSVAIAQIARFRGVDPTTPFDTGSTIPAANCTAGGSRVKCSYQNDNNITTGTETTTSASTLLLLAAFIGDNNATNAGNGFTEAFDSGTFTGGGAQIALNYRVETTAGAKGPFSFSMGGGFFGGSDPNTGVLFALRAVVSPPITLTTSGSTQVGDFLLAAVAVQPSTVTITPPAGWMAQTPIVQAAGNPSRQQIFYRFADTAGATAYTWTFSGTHAGAVGGLTSYAGVDATTPIDAFGGNTTPSSVNHTANAITTTVDNTRVVSVHSFTSSENWSAPGGMTERVDVASLPTGQASGISMEMADVAQPSAGSTGNKTATTGGNADWGAAHLIALRPSISFDFFYGDYYTPRCAISPAEVTVIVRDATGKVQTGYTGTVFVGTTTFNGTWSIASANGTLNNIGSGAASYQFVAADRGMVRLNLANTNATTLTVGAQDQATGITMTASTSINFINEGYHIVLDPVQVAGRPQNITVRHLVAPACTASTSNGHNANNAIRAWLTLAPTHPAAATLPSATGVNTVNPLPTTFPGANNLTLNFAGPGALVPGEARLTLNTTDVGKYVLNLRDGTSNIRGTAIITTRPFGLAFRGANASTPIAHGTDHNSTPFAAAGDNFTMTLAAYRWATGEDSGTAGVPDGNANITDNLSTARFAADVDVTPTGSLPAAFVGEVFRGASCANPATVAAGSFSGGAATVTDWCYTEAGNVFLTATAFNYLETPGVNVTGNSGLDGSGPTPGGHVGRFRPKHFALSSPTLTNRADITAACGAASTFTYMDERLDLGFTLTAQNTQGNTTKNYNGAYAKLNLNSAAALALGARSGATNLTGRISATSSTTWANGVASFTTSKVQASITRSSPPDGPYAGVAFGIAPNDPDGVQMNMLDLDVNNDATNDHKNLGVTTAVRFGRMRLSNAYGSGLIDLPVDLRAEYYNGSGFTTNDDDNCTTFIPNNFSFQPTSYTGGITGSNLPEGNISISGALVSGVANLRIVKPSGTLASPGGVTLCLDLDAGSGGDSSCAALTPGDKTYLQGPWGAATYDRDPKAGLGFGLYGAQPRNFIFFRENY